MRYARLAAVALLTLLVTCDRPTSLTGPSAAISDGMHLTGNRNFFFLPPLVPDPRGNPYYDADGFDATARPTVEICRLAGAACAAEQPAGFPIVFTMDAGRGSETVRVDVEAQQYIVNWHAGDFPLDPASNYRIRVLVAGGLLGYADVDVVSSGRELRNVNTNEFIGLVDGRTLPIKFRIERGAVVAIGITETLVITDGVVLLPPAAVRIDEAIGVRDATTALAPVALDVTESIQVADVGGILPPASISVVETVAVADALRVVPPALLDVVEQIGVRDDGRTLPPVLVAIAEAVAVGDGRDVLPPVTISINESIAVTDHVAVTPP